MKQWKKLTALLLAGVLALTVLTGCDSKTGAAVNGKNIVENYLAFYEKWPMSRRGPGEYDESMDAVAGKALDIIAETVDSGVEWDDVVDGYLTNDVEGFTAAGAELKKVILGNAEPENYKFILALNRIPDAWKDSPTAIAYALYDPWELGWVQYTTYNKPWKQDPNPDAKYKMGAAVKEVNGETYALLVGLVVVTK